MLEDFLKIFQNNIIIHLLNQLTSSLFKFSTNSILDLSSPPNKRKKSSTTINDDFLDVFQPQIQMEPPPLVYTQKDPPPLAVIEYPSSEEWKEVDEDQPASNNVSHSIKEKDLRLEIKEIRASIRQIQATTSNIERKMDIIISHLERQCDMEVNSSMEKYSMPTLPLTTPAQLKKFNDELLSDSTYLTQVVSK